VCHVGPLAPTFRAPSVSFHQQILAMRPWMVALAWIVYEGFLHALWLKTTCLEALTRLRSVVERSAVKLLSYSRHVRLHKAGFPSMLTGPCHLESASLANHLTASRNYCRGHTEHPRPHFQIGSNLSESAVNDLMQRIDDLQHFAVWGWGGDLGGPRVNIPGCFCGATSRWEPPGRRRAPG